MMIYCKDAEEELIKHGFVVDRSRKRFFKITKDNVVHILFGGDFVDSVHLNLILGVDEDNKK